MNKLLERSLEKAAHLPVRVRVAEIGGGALMLLAGDVPVAGVGFFLALHGLLGGVFCPSFINMMNDEGQE